MGFSDRPYSDGGRGGGFGGGRLGGLMMPNWPSVTAWMIIINIAVLFVDSFLGRIQHGPGGLPGALTEWGYFSADKGIMGFQLWRVLTYQFLHAGGWHLFGNMLMLFFFGSMVEDRFGSKRFVGLYLLCGVAGALLYLILLGLALAIGAEAAGRVPFLLIGSADSMLVGASAAVFGVLIAAWRIAPNATVLLFFVIPVPLRLLIMIIILVEIYIVMVGGSNSGGSAAHLGGLALGAILVAKPHWLNWCLRIDPSRVKPARIKQDAKRGAFERQLRKDEAMEQEVDRILEKVAKDGIHSLSNKEKKTLREATERQRGG